MVRLARQSHGGCRSGAKGESRCGNYGGTTGTDATRADAIRREARAKGRQVLIRFVRRRCDEGASQPSWRRREAAEERVRLGCVAGAGYSGAVDAIMTPIRLGRHIAGHLTKSSAGIVAESSRGWIGGISLPLAGLLKPQMACESQRRPLCGATLRGEVWFPPALAGVVRASRFQSGACEICRRHMAGAEGSMNLLWSLARLCATSVDSLAFVGALFAHGGFTQAVA